jgi:catechol 2,3-dioxygenase-like lactoylglutathione lyase family enzyme
LQEKAAMPVERLEHFLVVSDDIDATRDFYRDLLGMRAGFRPELAFPGYWMYLGDVGCLHIAEWNTYRQWTAEVDIPMSSPAPGSGPVDHIAFNASDFDGTVRKIEAHGLPYKQNLLDDIGLRQIFIKDPNNITLELNFREPR